ncbi:MAG: four helix bundle suffix domain-containing protein [bacterium]
MSGANLITPHGGYRKLKSYQAATIIYDFTFHFCKSFINDYRLRDQMVHAARSGRQNIAEGCQASGVSKKSEIKLVNVARASLEELLCDYEDFLRQRDLEQWPKDHPTAEAVRALAYSENRSYKTYETYIADRSAAANTAICLIHQACYLLDKQLVALGNEFLQQGGFTERMYKKRREERGH